MQLGVTMFVTDQSMPVTELATAVEERGLASLFLPEHTHMPINRTVGHPSGRPLPEPYKRTLDPLVALSFAAAATTTITLGTGVMLVAQRDPLVTAKAVATLDLLANGRFTLGVGFGWNVEEAEHHGVPFKQRRDVAREHLLAMRVLWGREEAAVEGDHVRFEKSWSWPKPVGGPPVLIGGGAGPKLFTHVAEYADGWMPIGGSGLKDAIPDLHRACETAGRDPAQLSVVPFAIAPTPGKLEYYATLGVEHCVADLPSVSRDTVLPILDGYAEMIS